MDVSQYLEIFLDETNEHLQNLNTQILELESDPENMDNINEIFRAAHSLKGMAGTMGYKRMQNLTHDMENVFQEVRSEKVKVTSSMIDLLFKCLDAIEGYLDNVKASSDEGTEDNELIISVEKKNETKEEDKERKGTYLRREFSYTQFQQSLLLPDNIERENISAKVENGVMTIDIPKKKIEETAAATRQIEVK